MVRTSNDEAADCRQVVEPILESLRTEIAADLEWELIPDLGSEFDAVALDLVRDAGRSRVFVTFEAWVNARTDSDDLQRELQQLVKKVGKDKDLTFIISSAGIIEKSRRTSTEQILDEVAGIEAEAETERLRKALGTSR